MVFNSYTFLVFFACVVAVHRLPIGWTWKKVNLLLASYLFYAAWNPPFVILLGLSTVVDWQVGHILGDVNAGHRKKKLALLCSLAVNLGLLGLFKYGNFLLVNFTALLSSAGIEYVAPEWNLVLPVGISFYTFQTLSYSIDIYRGKSRPWNSILDFALYVSFFPQLVAGPIVRASTFLPQCEQYRRISAARFSWGCTLFLLGLFQKSVVADAFLAPIVDKVYSESSADFISAWAGTCAFAGQIFCDFSGYSTCAIGVAMCLGFALPDNFRCPYAAIGLSDFWRRWHVSLSSWLKDYMYIPLGGNRSGTVRTGSNLMITMLVGGLWHGAAWHFVVWGALHGVFLIAERPLTNSRVSKFSVWQTMWGRGVLRLLTFVLVCFAWTFFRADSLSQATDFAVSMTMPFSDFAAAAVRSVSEGDALIALGITGSLIVIHWQLQQSSFEDAFGRLPGTIRIPILAALFCAVVLMPGDNRAFIYFQF